MSSNPNAFPIPGLQDDAEFNGMTLRDYFAAKAMQGWATNPDSIGTKKAAEWAYEMADAMLAARGAA